MPSGEPVPNDALMLYNPTNPLNKLLDGYEEYFTHRGKEECPIEECKIYEYTDPSDTGTFACETNEYSK